MPNSNRHYFDHASNSPLRPEVARAIESWIASGSYGDPGRVHREGYETRVKIEEARDQVANLVGASSRQVVFTSGGTESINHAIFGAISKVPGGVIISSGVEHSSVKEAAIHFGEPFGSKLLEVEVNQYGQVDPSAIKEAIVKTRLSGVEVALVNCQWANHEVGTVQKVEEIAQICNDLSVPLHVDAIAALGHLPISINETGVDAMSISAHKIGGPPGVGALVLGKGKKIPSLIYGGLQERGRRAGMENVPGIIGFGALGELLGSQGWIESQAKVELIQSNAIRKSLSEIDGVSFYGHPIERLPNIISLGVKGIEAEPILISLDQLGLSLHSGSSCSSESLEPSPVLEAMGVDANHSLRISLGWSTSNSDIEMLSSCFRLALDRLRALVS